MRIELSDNIYERYKDDFRLYSDINVTIGSFSFPCRNWDDNSVGILSSWTHTMLQIGYNVAVLHFFEGPYQLYVLKEGDSVHVQYFDCETMVAEENMLYISFLEELLSGWKRFSVIVNKDPLKSESIDFSGMIASYIIQLTDCIESYNTFGYIKPKYKRDVRYLKYRPLNERVYYMHGRVVGLLRVWYCDLLDAIINFWRSLLKWISRIYLNL